jgi:hypothetical protein
MKIFYELRSLYLEIETYYSEKQFEARKKKWHIKEREWSRKRELNDHTYFLFLFTRLEGLIRDKVSDLITKKQSCIRSWRQRSAWDILPSDKDDDKISFKNRLALVVEKGSGDFGKIVIYYQERNHLAHGKYFSSHLSMPIVFNEFERFDRKIRNFRT